MSESIYYDGTKLLSMKDANGEVPEIYICTSNRNAGKTTYFSRLLVNRFLDKQEKFCLIYRFNYELDDCSKKFFDDIRGLFFRDYVMTNKRPTKNAGYQEIFLNNIKCGYAIALNQADQIKKASHLLSDTKRMFFDEFQSENNHYCADEVQKLQSVHTSIARGNFEQVRYLPVYMVGNAVSLLNPYYTALGISGRLRAETKFLKGEGFVLEQGYNETAAAANRGSAFNRAFKNTKYGNYAAENIYLNDNLAFIDKPSTKGVYLCTLKCDGSFYGVREYAAEGIIYCDNRPDLTYPLKIAVTTEDHQINYVMLRRNDEFIQLMKRYYLRGCFRFKDLRAKEAVMKALSY